MDITNSSNVQYQYLHNGVLHVKRNEASVTLRVKDGACCMVNLSQTAYPKCVSRCDKVLFTLRARNLTSNPYVGLLVDNLPLGLRQWSNRYSLNGCSMFGDVTRGIELSLPPQAIVTLCFEAIVNIGCGCLTNTAVIYYAFQGVDNCGNFTISNPSTIKIG